MHYVCVALQRLSGTCNHVCVIVDQLLLCCNWQSLTLSATHADVTYQGMERLTAHKAEKSGIDSCMTASVVIMARLLVRLTLNSGVPSRFCFCLAAPLAATFYQNNA